MNKMKYKVIRYISVIMCICIFLLASRGIYISQNIEDRGDYIYDYYKYTSLVNVINENIVNIKINLINIASEYEEKYKEKIEESNDKVHAGINEYNATEYEEEEEEIYVDIIENAYNEYYELVNESINIYKNDGNLEENKVIRLSELEEIMNSNINKLQGYLDMWAENDQSMIDEIFNTSLICYYMLAMNSIAIIIIISRSICKVNNINLRESK